MKVIIATGKRKTAIAKAALREGTGRIRINKILLDVYKPNLYRMKLREPLMLAGDIVDKVDIDVHVSGGGINGQVDAARVAMSKALVAYTKSDKLKSSLLSYDRNLLVPDIRIKETHKPNRHGKARAKVQKSYR